MTDTLFSAIELEDGGESLAGYRLQRVEVLNWGTFDSSVWSLSPQGMTSLLTGDIGSGKSTLVDAVTTLLLPANRIAYNRAAGADTKERTLRSYVEGHYRSERNEATGASRPVGLRDHRSYSVILGAFANEGYGEAVTIAQVFHQQDRSGQPDRFFVTASRDLSVEEHFSGFGAELKTLRTRLRAAGAEIDTTFPEYQRRVRRLLGIRSEQAMDLFHQTVSMKSVGNLTEFVRGHMLEPSDADARIRAIVDHFENLTKAHEAVRRATDQVALLSPLVEVADRYDAAADRRRSAEAERDALGPFIAEQVLELLAGSIAAQDALLRDLRAEAERLAGERRALRPERERLIAERAGVGGDRLSVLDVEIPRAAMRIEERVALLARFAGLLDRAGLPAAASESQFGALAARLEQERSGLDTAKRRLDGRQVPLQDRASGLRVRRKDLQDEIDAIERYRNMLPMGLAPLRARLCGELGIAPDRLPFVAELLDIDPAHRTWRGAAERVLRPFALSLLVPQAEYPRVSAWVNEEHLGTRLVFLRVADRRVRALLSAHDADLRLLDVVTVESGPFAEFLRSELAGRADHRLVADVAGLQREDRAVTREGLVRDRDRHEKDDRRRADDPREWVLGRGTEQKLAVLRDEADRLTVEARQVEEAVKALADERDALGSRREALAALAEYRSWTDLDVDAARTERDALQQERTRLVGGSSALAEIDRRLDALATDEDALERRAEAISQQVGAVRSERAASEARAQRDRQLLAALPPAVLDPARERYAELERRAGVIPDSVEDWDALRDRLQRGITGSIDTAQREMNGFTTSIQQQMGEILRRWPELRGEMDASVQSIGEYRALHERVLRDDLPRFEGEFKTQLNTNAIRELAQFNNWLNRQAEEIHERVDRINEALGQIDYNPGRRIELVAETTVNQEVRQFRSGLREATSDLLGTGDLDAEARFERVRVVIERFQGREGRADSDRVWTRRVTDVRNWFTFAASERDKETHAEYEHYTDSDGKSGGQKEKLAYTILAASLAYQFGLTWGAPRSKDFRFAVIDEAFGRGSDLSTRYALDLFARLGLQLLIVTPLQKVHVIEPYVHAIGFVDNPTGASSRVHTLTIEEFQERRREAQA